MYPKYAYDLLQQSTPVEDKEEKEQDDDSDEDEEFEDPEASVIGQD